MTPILLDTPTPKLHLTIKLSKNTTLVLTLLNGKDHQLAQWIEHEKRGSQKLALLLPASPVTRATTS